MDCIWVNLKNGAPPFFKFISVYIKISFTQLENDSQFVWGRDFENETVALQIWSLELISDKIKQNYQK